ncbi:L,D-transpeptidase [Devosia sp.]|uniref:L,D-transpeptidase n=1 Tax=Devosia sp. TaxID=1871048 RepID=UPI003A8FD62D
MTSIRTLLFCFTACIGLGLAMPPASAGTLVAYAASARAGVIIVDTSARQLYLVLGNGQALRYPVGVGRAGRQWAGTSRIAGRYSLPAWAPPAAIRAAQPELPALIAGGAPGNPMGAAAMTLAGGNYAIHGTNSPGSIGGFVSYGCIRMYNADIIDLMSRVRVGTPVEVRL